MVDRLGEVGRCEKRYRCRLQRWHFGECEVPPSTLQADRQSRQGPGVTATTARDLAMRLLAFGDMPLRIVTAYATYTEVEVWPMPDPAAEKRLGQEAASHVLITLTERP